MGNRTAMKQMKKQRPATEWERERERERRDGRHKENRAKWIIRINISNEIRSGDNARVQAERRINEWIRRQPQQQQQNKKKNTHTNRSKLKEH